MYLVYMQYIFNIDETFSDAKNLHNTLVPTEIRISFLYLETLISA